MANKVTISSDNSNISVTQEATKIVQVNTIGPQGPKGDTGAIGNAASTSSLISTASISSNIITFTKGDTTQFTLDINTVPTASYITASNIDGDVGFTPSLSTDITTLNITASGNIWASGSGGYTGFVYSDAYFLGNAPGSGTNTQRQLFTRLNNIIYVGDNTLDELRFSNGIERFWVQSNITASGAISASGFISAFGSSSLSGLPTTEPNVTGALWISGSSEAHPNSGYLMVFNP